MKLKEIIKKIEAERSSKVIVYFTSDRPNLGEMIVEDIIEVFHDILVDIDHSDKIDLIIYSRGGQTIVPLPLVKLIRKFCDKFSVLVPFRAHSAATMIALGADDIYMTKLAELGPVDPQIGFSKQNGAIRIAAVDVFAYLEFTKEHLNMDYRDTADGIEILRNFHQYSGLSPSDLAVLYRNYKQSFEYAKQLAEMSYSDSEVVEKLCKSLITNYGSHDYKIDAAEAKKIGLNIIPHTNQIDSLLHSIYAKISNEIMLLKTPFSVDPAIGTKATGIQGLISSKQKCYTKEINFEMMANPTNPELPAFLKQSNPMWSEKNEYLSR